jgi:hypothetical protein
VIPTGKRLQHILRRRVASVDEPHVRDFQLRERLPRFDLADVAERGSLFRTRFIGSAASTRSEYDAGALALVHRLGEISRGGCFVIRMCHHQQDIQLVALVGSRQRFHVLRKARDRRSHQHGHQHTHPHEPKCHQPYPRDFPQ